MPITINYSQVAATLTNFPVLIALTNNSNLGSNVAIPSTGQDIIFTDDTGVTPLNYEIEYYANSGTPTVGTLDAWVNIPYLSNTQNTTIYMYYGNASAPANITNYATWIASIYDAVYHLNNLSLVNSAPTGNQNNLTNNGATNNAYPNSAIAGGAGCSITPGTGKFLSNAAAAGLPSTTAPQTLSAWAYFNTGEAPYATTQQNDNENLVDTFNATTTAAVQLGFRSQEYITWRYGGTALVQCTGTVPPANQWNYYVYTYDGTTDRLYLNGTQCNSTTVTNAVSSVPLDDGVCSYPGGQEYWVGNIDEPRVESGARSANWILTEYNNQNPSTQSSFFSVGTQSQNSTANVVIQGDTRIRGGTKIQ
jgi:MSHA biogenesis protein MshQ